MVELAGHYDTSAAPQEDFGPIPAGEYEAEIIDSSVEDISRNDDKGQCLLVVWKVLNGDYAGRQVWQRLNLWFTGAEKTPGKVVQIANGEFASIREATGIKTPNDSAELHNIPCIIRVAYVEQQGYQPKNEVKHVKARDAVGPAFNAPAPANGSGAPRSSGPPAPTGKSMPWGQRKTA